jgi:hypothetical protein
MDLAWLALVLVLFVVSLGLIALCDRKGERS